MATRKIVYLVTKDDVGGAQKYVQDLCENLDKSRFEAKIVTGGKKGIRFLSNAFLPYALFMNDWLALTELVLFFRKEKPDIVHLNSSKAGVVGAIAAKIAGVPHVVFTAHGWVFNPDSQLGAARRTFYIALHKLAAKFQDRIINVSEYDRRLALTHRIAPAHKLATVYNGIDREKAKFLDKKTARSALSQMTGRRIPLTGTWIGSIGRLVKEKSYGDFIEAATMVSDPSAQFFIIGSGTLKKDLEIRIREAGLAERFFIIENVSPAAAYIQAFDVFALSSIKEGMPYTLIEAMAAGLPIVVTRVGGMPEIIDALDEAKRGLAMPPRSPEELARAINYFLENKKEAVRYGRNAQQYQKSRLALSSMVAQTEAAYQLTEAS